MADIKTRDAVKGTIKTIDKVAVASQRMKTAYAKTKEKAEQGYYAEENSPTEYAADRVSHTSERVADEGVHQFNKHGQKAVRETRENIGKAKDKIADFKTRRAMKAAEQRHTQQGVYENIGSQIRDGAASRSEAFNAPAQTIKTRQAANRTIKQSARNTEQTVKTATKGTVKTTAKGTVKTADKTVKTAQATSRTAIKTSEQAVKSAQRAAKASVKTAEKAAKAAKASAKAAAEATKKTVKATIAAVKAIIAGTKALITAIAAGGWIAVVIILVVVLLGCAVAFFGGSSNSSSYTPVSAEVEAYEPLIQKYARQYGIPEYVELIKAVMMQESGGRGLDPMQAERLGWSSYGDTQYVNHVLRYYPIGRAFTSGGNQVIVEVALTQLGNEGGSPIGVGTALTDVWNGVPASFQSSGCSFALHNPLTVASITDSSLSSNLSSCSLVIPLASRAFLIASPNGIKSREKFLTSSFFDTQAFRSARISYNQK